MASSSKRVYFPYLNMILNLYITLQPKLFQLFQGLLEKYDPQQYLTENFIKLTSCSSNLVEYLFFHIRLWKMYHVPLKDLWMSLRTSSKIQIIINNLMLFKHQNGLLLIIQEKKEGKTHPLLSLSFYIFLSCKELFHLFFKKQHPLEVSWYTTSLQNETSNIQFKASDAQTKRLNED